MKNFLYKISLFIFIIISTCIIFLIVPGNYNDVLSAIINKTDLLKNTKSPKIIFIGGSGLYVGLDSPYIERITGYSVVNMGLWSGFELKFMIETVKPYINKGDIVIIVPEYRKINDDSINSIDPIARKWLYLTSKNSYYEYIKTNELISDLTSLTQLKIQAFMINFFTLNFHDFFIKGRINYSKNINSSGDVIVDPFPQRNLKKLNYNINLPEFRISKKSYLYLNNFNSYVKKSGGKVFLAFSCYPINNYQLNKKQINSLVNDFKKNLQIKLLGLPDDYLYSYDYFSNSFDHLNRKGKKLRTEKLGHYILQNIN